MSFIRLFLLYLIACQLSLSFLVQSAPDVGSEPTNSSINAGPTTGANFFLPYTGGMDRRIHHKRHKVCKGNSKSCLRFSIHHRCCFHSLCVDLSTNSNHCGSCGRVCKKEMKCCAGVCVDIGRDKDHCGKCRNACLPDESCDFGMCSYG